MLQFKEEYIPDIQKYAQVKLRHFSFIHYEHGSLRDWQLSYRSL